MIRRYLLALICVFTLSSQAGMYKGIKKKKLRVNLGRDPRKAERYFGELLLAMLEKQGVSVGNSQIVQGLAPPQAPFYTHQNSKTLGEMIRPMMKYSTNFIANQLVLMMAICPHDESSRSL